MDSDFAHEPRDIKRLVKESKKYDLVIGSRYMMGGRTISYSFPRKIFSRLANLFSNFLLGLNIRDYTSGFRCYKREVLESIGIDTIRSRGFIVLSEMAYKTKKKNFSIGEVPIIVKYHPSYKSNLNLAEIFNAFIGIIIIKFRN
jgi:dolichol-phosphate mannosyltransferase